MADPGVAHVAAEEEYNYLYNNFVFLPNLENVLPEALLDHPAVIAFQSSKSSFIATNARFPGNPIVYASPGFLELTGYSIDRVLGRNCRFLQGPETDPTAVAKMREAIDQGQDNSACIINYRRDGSTFWNKMFISAVRDAQGDITHYIGWQCPVSSPTAQVNVTSNQEIQFIEEGCLEDDK
jgi:PAS domain S-box-containing protein